MRLFDSGFRLSINLGTSAGRRFLYLLRSSIGASLFTTLAIKYSFFPFYCINTTLFVRLLTLKFTISHYGWFKWILTFQSPFSHCWSQLFKSWFISMNEYSKKEYSMHLLITYSENYLPNSNSFLFIILNISLLFINRGDESVSKSSSG